MKHTMMTRIARGFAGLLLAATLASCGGGGGDAGCNRYEGCGPAVDDTATAQQLRMTLSAYNVINGALADVTATVTALDSSNRAVKDVDVTYSVSDESTIDEDAGAFVGANSPTTDAQGKSTAQISLGTDKSNRLITVTATVAGGVSVSKTVEIRGSAIAVSGDTLVDATDPETIIFSVRDSNGGPQAGVPINVQSTGIGTSSGVTDSNGAFPYNYTVPNSPGVVLTFTASAAGVTEQFTVSVRAPAQQLPAPDFTNQVTPALQVNPNVIAVNSAGSTANKMQVVASFEDSAGNPIPNVRVSFRLSGATASSVGGQFSNGPTTGTPVAYSGADGKVQVFYVPGAQSSGSNAIEVQACWGSTDAEAVNCTGPNTPLLKPITIAEEAVSVSIGTDGLLLDEEATLQYAQRYVIKVVNSAGQPKAGLTVSAQINTVNFIKGYYERVAQKWTSVSRRYQCAKEDLDDDDLLDSSPVNEDRDFDGRLEPIRSYVSLEPVNGWVTNADGVVIVKMSYPKNVASWMTVNIISTALVGGSEGRATRQQVLSVPSKVLESEEDPPFIDSPYGVVISGIDPCIDPN